MADLTVEDFKTELGVDQDVPKEERALVAYWQSQIDRCKPEHERLCKELDKNRGYVEGRLHDDGHTGLVRANLIYATLATLIPYVYAKDPDIAVQLTDAVSPDVYELFRGFARTAEIVLRHEFVEKARLKKRVKTVMRAAFTTRVGWVKLIYQRDFNTDPLMRMRMNDAQDNLARVQQLIAESKDEVDLDEKSRMQSELEAQVMALEKQLEQPIAEGIVLDRIRTEDLMILDTGLQDFDDYEKAVALDHVVWMSPEDFGAAFGVNMKDPQAKKPTIYSQKSIYGDTSSADRNKQKFVRVHEIWHRTSNTIYTIADGYSRFCRAPYQPQRLGRRWYSFFGLAFYPLEGRFWPLSLPELLIELVDEYNTTRTQYAEHRADSLPVRVVRKGGSLTEEDVKAIQNRRALDIIAVEGTAGVPIGQDIGHLPNAPIDPATYDVTQIRNDIDLVSGLSDASRSNLIDPKTATEAEILREGMMSRTTEMQDMIEDLISEMADYGLQVLLMELTEAQVVKIAGPGAVWPRIAREDVYNMVRVRVRGGSTGKPNKREEREQWLQLLPQLQQAIQTVSELMAQGMAPIADAMVELLKETLQRFDEKIDVAKFLPFAKSNDPAGAGEGVAGLLPNQGVPPEQVAELEQAYQAAVEQVQQLETALNDKRGQEEQAVAQRQSDYDQAVAEAQASAAAEIEKARAEAEARTQEAIAKSEAEIEKARISQEEAEAKRQHDRDMAQMEAQSKLREVVVKEILKVMTAGGDAGGELPDPQAVADALSQFGLGADTAQVVGEAMDTARRVRPRGGKATSEVTQGLQKSIGEAVAEIKGVVAFLKAKRTPIRDKSGRITQLNIEGLGVADVKTDANGRIVEVGPIQAKEVENANSRT